MLRFVAGATSHRDANATTAAAGPLPLTFRHWAGISPYTSACAVAGTCVFGKQSLEPMSCGPLAPTWSVAHPPPLKKRGGYTPGDAGGAPLLPKLRGQIAEFLNRGSLVHLKGVPPAHQCRCAVRATMPTAARPGSRTRHAPAGLEAFLGGLPTTPLPPPPRELPPRLRAPCRPPTPERAGRLVAPPASGFAWTLSSAKQPALSIRPADAGYRVPPSPHACVVGAGLSTRSPSPTPALCCAVAAPASA